MSEKTSPIRPLNDRVVVRLYEEELVQFQRLGLSFQKQLQRRNQNRIVLATGPGKWDEDGKRIPLDVKEGDRVIFSKYGYDEVKLKIRSTLSLVRVVFSEFL